MEEKSERDSKFEVTLFAVGDVMMGDHPITIGHGVASVIKKKGPRHVFEKVAPVLNEGDVVFGNLETALSSKNLNKKSLESVQLRGEPTSVDGLKYAGFNILSLANNHILDHGEEAMLDTMETLSSKGIRYLDGIARKPLLVEIKGLKMVFLAHNLVREKIAPRNVSTHSNVIDSVKAAKDIGDIIVVSLHWGDEYVCRPSLGQIRTARQIIDSGARIILGHHPHVIQGLERYRDGFVAYSLGNFVFDTHHEKTRETAILKFNISKDGKIDAKPIPVIINDSYQPEVVQGDKARKIESRIDELSSELEKEELSDFDAKSKMYDEEVKLNLQQYGKESRRYFLKNLHRYPKGMLPHLFMKSIKQRAGSK